MDEFIYENSSDFHKKRLDTTIEILNKYYSTDSNLRILDVGCGKGIITQRIKQIFDCAEIDAIDNSPSEISFCLKKYKNIRFAIMDVNDIKSEERIFDIIILNNVFEHLENPFIVLKNLKNYLKDEGIIIISTPNRFRLQNLLRAFIGKSVGISKEHITEFSIGQMKEISNHVELNIINLITPDILYNNKSRLWNIVYSLLKIIIDTYSRTLKSSYNTNPIIFYVLKKA